MRREGQGGGEMERREERRAERGEKDRVGERRTERKREGHAEITLSMRRSGFGTHSVGAPAASDTYSVHVPVASSHTQCTAQQLRRLLSARSSSFGEESVQAAAFPKIFLKRRRLLSICQSCWGVH